MPFDGPLLAAGAIQAIAALPGAIRDFKDLLREKSIDRSIDQPFNAVLDHVRQLAAVQESLGESKRIHDALHRLDIELEEVRAAFSNAVAEGRFIRDRYPLPRVRLAWQSIVREPLNMLKVEATALEHLEARPLQLDSGGHPVDGPEWVILLLDRAEKISQMFRGYDEASLEIKCLVDALDVFSTQVKTMMEMADRRILREFDEIHDRFFELSAALRYL